VSLTALFNWSCGLGRMYRARTNVLYRTNVILGVGNLEVAMAVLARAFWRAFPLDSPELEVLTQVVMFCGAGLLVSLLMMTYGLDLSPGFF
jgi:hypothetical protein